MKLDGIEVRVGGYQGGALCRHVAYNMRRPGAQVITMMIILVMVYIGKQHLVMQTSTYTIPMELKQKVMSEQISPGDIFKQNEEVKDKETIQIDDDQDSPDANPEDLMAGDYEKGAVIEEEEEEEEEEKPDDDSQDSRLAAMSRSCWNHDSAHTINDLTYSVRDHIHVHDEYKVMYCLIPKVGCTNMKRLFINISTHGTDKRAVRGFPHSYEKMANAGVYPLHNFKDEELVNRVKNYYKVILVRHPLVRLLSAYRNKFVERNPLYPKSVGTKIVKKYRANATEKSLKEGHDVKYEEFVQFLIDIGLSHGNFDQHWAPYDHLCDPCNIKYDFVMKLETMDQDMEYIRNKIYNGSTDAMLPAAYQKPTENDLIKQYYSNITAEQLTNLTELYINDFKMYGFNTELSSVLH